jgi:uncharacterized membrane protein
MNIHPMFVHFPVALFLVYCLFEVLRIKILTRQSYYFYVKACLVIVGAISTIPTIIAGGLAKQVYTHPLIGDDAHTIIGIHANFAVTTAAFFIIVAFFYVIGWLRRNNKLSASFPQFLIKIEMLITESPWGILVALVGAALISTVGALGGLIAYGPENDAISKALYHLIKGN